MHRLISISQPLPWASRIYFFDREYVVRRGLTLSFFVVVVVVVVVVGVVVLDQEQLYKKL